MELWDLVSAGDLTIFSRGLPDEDPAETLRLTLPDRTIQGVKSRLARHSRTNVTAKYRAYNAETPIGKRPDSVVTYEWTLPPVGQKLHITEWEYLWLQFKQGGPAAVSSLIDTIYDDVERNVSAIRNRFELARGDLLCTGTFILSDENGQFLEADYAIPSTQKPTASPLWTNTSSSTPLDDEEEWIQIMIDASGRRPVRVYMAQAAVNDLLKNDQYRTDFWGPLAVSQPNLTRAQFDQVRQNRGLPTIVVNDHMLNVDNVDVRVMDDHLAVFVGPEVGETQHGITAESLELVTSNATDFTTSDAPGIFSALYKEADPVRGWTKSTAVGMPVLGDTGQLVIATIR